MEFTGFSSAVMAKAEKLVRHGDVSPDPQYPEIFWVRGSADRPYRVQVGTGFVTCTCAHGLNKGGGDASCSHVAAAGLFAEKQKDERMDGDDE